MKNIIKNKRKWIVLVSISSYLILLIVLGLVLRNHLPIYLPNEEKRLLVKFSRIQRGTYLVLRVNHKERDNLQVEMYDKKGKKIPLPFSSSGQNPHYSKGWPDSSDGPKEGYFYDYGDVNEDEVVIVTKNKTNHIIFSKVSRWYTSTRGDAWFN